MDKTKAFLLADALESGKYQQGKCALNNRGKYCCLGVACEIFGVQRTLEIDSMVHYDKDGYVLGHNNAQGLVGIRTPGGSFHKPITVKRLNGYKQVYSALYEMNDDRLSFKFIAKILRKHYKNII